MNFRTLIYVFVLSFVLSACSSLGSFTSQDQAYPTPIQNLTITPSQNQDAGLAYPQYNDGDEISWNIAVTVLLNGEVVKIAQLESLKVMLTLKDGRSLITYQPLENEVLNWIDKCGDPCKQVEIISD